MTSRIILSAFILVGLSFGLAFGADVDSVEINLVGTGLWSYIDGYAIEGDYAFCAMKFGLMIVDISDPANPVAVSQYYLPVGNGVDVAVSGKYLFLCCRSGDLQIFDISDIFSPTFVTRYDVDGSVEHINLDGNYAYLSITDGFDIVDITDPTVPFRVGGFKGFLFNTPFDIAVRDNFLLAANYDGLTVYDITDPENPVIDTIFETEYTTRGMAVVDTTAYLVTDTAFHIISISDPTNLYLIGTGDCRGRDIEVLGESAVIATIGQVDGVHVYDISDPTAPLSVGFMAQTVYSLGQGGGYIFTSDISSFLDIIDISNPAEPISIGTFFTPDGGTYGMRNIVCDGEYAYIAYGYAGLAIADITDPTNPKMITHGVIPNRTSNVKLVGRKLYVTSTAYDGQGLHIVDINDPENPVVTGTYEYGSPQDVALLGKYAILAGNYGNAEIADISAPANPTFVSNFRLGGITYGLVIEGDYLYAANGMHYLKTIDISDINSPTVIDSIYITQSVYDVVVYKSYLLLSVQGGIYVFDITSDPTAPAQVTFLAIDGHSYHMVPYGDYIVVAAGYSGGLVIADMTDPTIPEIAASYTIPGTIKGVDVFGNYIYAFDTNGMFVFQCNLPSCCLNGGDASFDAAVDIGDAVYLLNYIFKYGMPINCPASADANGDCIVDVGDVVFLINYLARGGATPVCSDCIK